MMIHDITALAGKYKDRKRVGRGHGTGQGKQAGRGHKGAGSRSGTATRYQYEGGQMPYFRRLPKFGFTNAKYKTLFWVVNLADIVTHPSLAKGGKVNVATLTAAGLVRDDSRDLKILGDLPKGGLKVKLDVETNRISQSARNAVLAAGGSVNETGTRRDRVRGVDRNSEDRTPKNLTKKLTRRSAKPTKAPAADAE